VRNQHPRTTIFPKKQFRSEQTMTRNTLRVLTAAAAISVCASTASASTNRAALSTQEAAQTLQELRNDKRALATKLDELYALARNNHLTSWQSHAILFEEIRAIINRAGARLSHLEPGMDAMPAGKQAAVEAVRSDLARIAPEVNALMNEMREFQLITLRPEYTSRVRVLSDRAIEARKNTDRVVRMALSPSANQPTGD
jgi:hypothetical protein